MTREELNKAYGEKLKNKIKEIMKEHKIKSSDISEASGRRASTTSDRINNLPDGNLVSIELIRILEELSGEKIINM